jgi:ADP-heptose:LPS heptosyltransferase
LNLKNILIFRTGHLGDTLVSLPAFWGIRKAFPDSRLTLLSNVNASSPKYVLAQSILPESGLFDNWLTYPSGLGKVSMLQQFAKLFREIRRNKYDAVFYLMTRNRIPKQVKRDIQFFRLAGIKKNIGTKYLLEHYLDPNTPLPLPFVETEAEYLINCLANEGVVLDESHLKPELLLTGEEKNFAKAWFEKNCTPNAGQRKFIAVAPGSKWESKIWEEEKFYQLGKLLIEEKNFYPIIFGGQEDREKGNRLIKRWGIGANAAGDLNIRQAAAALGKCELYVGNDTGTMHLAASVGTICVGIFSAIDWEGRWNPFGRGHQIIRKKVECEGCLSPNSFNGNICLKLIDVKEVYEACLNAMSEVKKIS